MALISKGNTHTGNGHLLGQQEDSINPHHSLAASGCQSEGDGSYINQRIKAALLSQLKTAS